MITKFQINPMSPRARRVVHNQFSLRQYARQLLCLKICWLGLLLLIGNAYAGDDEEFLAAREAYRVHKLDRLNESARYLEGYVLQSYVSYWQLQSHLETAQPEEVRDFFTRYEDSPLVDRLRGDWLKVLGKAQRWDAFLSEYPLLVNEDKVVTCYAFQARFARGDKAAFQEAKPLWFTATDLPVNCSPVFDGLVNAGVLTREDIWARIRLALEAGNVSVAKSVMQYLPADIAPNPKALDGVAENPQRYLEKNQFNLKMRAGRELFMFGVYRIARTQLLPAFTVWEKMQGHFSDAERGYVWGQLALHAARQHDPVALSWFRMAENAQLDNNQLGWKVRAALRAQDWPEVLAGIQAMSEAEQRNAVWRYWKARALKAQGKLASANLILAPLSKETNFYGQMASEELGAVLSNPTESYKASEEEIRAVKSLPGIQRALVLYQLNMRTEASREWLWATRAFDDKHLLAAAELARRNEWYDRAINTADKTVQLHDFSLRYLSPHRDVMQIYAKQWDLDEAWVYGLIRQESRFVTQARSSVGASGMMQLMPATAQWVAKRLGLKEYRDHLVNQIDTNISFGTYYLKHVMDSLDGSPVMATAAYNAGPGRARRWRDEKAMEGAVYAESIPFSETRDYVKKVMSNASYYASRFGQQMVSLKQRMGVIAGKSRSGDIAPDDEKQ